MKDINSMMGLLILIQYTIDKYFGNGTSHKNRQEIYLNKSLNDSNEDLSIKDFKEKNAGKCVEKAATVQNLLSFLGIDSTLVLSKMKVKGESELHAFNVLTGKLGNKVLFDVTNPVYCEWQDGSRQKVPAVTGLSENDYENILNGKSYKFSYAFIKSNPKVKGILNEFERQYGEEKDEKRVEIDE